MASQRVVLVTGEYPPQVGGVGDYTALLARHLLAEGATVSIVTGRSPGLPTEPVAARRIVADWGVRGWRGLLGALRAARPEVVHLQYQAGAFAGRTAIHLLPRLLRLVLRPVPLVAVTFHDLLAPYLFPKAGPLRVRALARLARDCDAVVATNGEDWRRLRADPRLSGKLHLIPIGSNIPPLAGDRTATIAGIRAALGVNVDTPLLAYFGLVSASKGVDLLLDALQRCQRRAPHLLLVGGEASASDRADFGAAGDLRAAIAARGLLGRVTITGSLPSEQVAAHLAAADVIVLPYRDGASWRRGSLLAALTAGVPVITTMPATADDTSGQLPSLTGGAPLVLVPSGDAGALARAIDRLLDDPALRADLAARSRLLAEAFDWTTIARRHLAMYGETSPSALRRGTLS